MPEAGRGDEALLLEAFAQRFGVVPGDTLPVVMEGVLRRVRVVGIATAPEFIYPTPPGGGLVPDDERFAVLWMDRNAVAPVFGMEGAFNDLVLRLQPGASVREVADRVDRVLEPYGGLGAVGRDLQPSNYILQGELQQLRQFATVVPIIFLGVAAFLLNVVLSRVVHLQRSQIAALKALGYPDLAIAGHYLKLVLAVVAVGVLLGIVGGACIGRGMTGLYGSVFGLPLLEFRVGPAEVLTGALVAVVAGVTGAFGALLGIMKLSPAEAMQPAPPATYRPSLPERLGLGALTGPSGRMVLREIGRHPVRTLLSSLGIAMAVAIVLVGRFLGDATDRLIELQFQMAWREQVAVDFIRPLPTRAVRELAHLPGVHRAEGVRITAARFRSGSLWRDGSVTGYQEEGELRQLLDWTGVRHPLPSGGLVLTRKLAEILSVAPGDSVTVEFREGARPIRRVLVAGTVDELFGLQGHLELGELNTLLGEAPTVSTALLRSDPLLHGDLQERLDQLPNVVSVSRPEQTVRRFREQSAEGLFIMTLLLTGFAMVIAVGVVYNNARVALSVRSRDLASLRVLGFTRGEISRILLGEMAVQIFLAVPVGFYLGGVFVRGVASTLDPERYRLPLAISMQSYTVAALVVLVAGGASALLVRRRLDRLDLIGVLKTRE
jgi:putative ABC transport system permease protein